MRAFDKGETTTKNTLEVLRDYWALINADKAKTDPTKVNKEIQVLTSELNRPLKSNHGNIVSVKSANKQE